MENPFSTFDIPQKFKKLCYAGWNEMREQCDDTFEYHNSRHILDVALATYDTGVLLNYDARKLGLGVFAAVYHDMIRGIPGDGEDETASAELAATTLSRSGGVSVPECEMVAEMIMGTFTRQERGSIYQPYARTTEQRWLAGADVCSFGMPPPEFKMRADAYYFEINPGKTVEDPEYTEFLKQDITVLKNYSFPLPVTETLYPHKTENYRMLEDLYTQLTSTNN